MPQLIVLAFGAIGAAVVAKWVVAQARRIKGDVELGGAGRAGNAGEQEQVIPLRRDPQTGVYRPK